jgi:formylglycine-generating enzyme required for sulfatase activity
MSAESERQAIKPAAFTPRGDDQGHRRFRARPLQMVLAAVLLLFALSLWFLFTAKSVLFTFDPTYSELEIEGGLQLQLGERYLLRSGEYQLRASAPGHYPLALDLVVGDEDAQSVHLQLQRLPGRLSFNSVPEGAQVLVDDQAIGSTPLEDVPVAAGDRDVRLLVERYLPQRQLIHVTGMEQAQEFSFELEPAWANIAISSVPVGATVYVDGEALATTPSLLELLQGEHQIVLEMPRFRSWQQALSVRAGVHQNLEPIVLAPAEGILQLSSRPSAASVTVDGEYRGQTPLELSLAPEDSHRIAVFKPGYSRAARTLALEPEEVRKLHLSLKPRLGDVLVRVKPAQAELFVNGRSRGRGSQTLSLPAYEQTLEVKLDGYRSFRQRFTPRQGLSQVIAVQLLTESEAKLAALEPEITSPAGQTLLLFTPGDFTMGASRREPGRRANEVLHPVSLTRMFYLGTREVSNLEFSKFRPQHNSGAVEGNSLNRDRQPAAMVSWEDAAKYCNWLSEQEKLPLFYRLENDKVIGFDVNSHGYRLPTEGEWAWAARIKGDSTLKFPWGKRYPPTEVLENYADSNSAYITGRTVANYDDGNIVAAPVGSYPANHHGLHDMGGNVAEWVHDVYSMPNSSGIPLVDPLGAQLGNNHVIRGASWSHGTVTELRLSFRDYGKLGRDDVGFRVARFAEEAP